MITLHATIWHPDHSGFTRPFEVTGRLIIAPDGRMNGRSLVELSEVTVIGQDGEILDDPQSLAEAEAALWHQLE